MVSLYVTIEAQSPPPSTMAQKAEIAALTGSLILVQGKKINVYIDSKYAFLVLNAHAAIWKERGLLTARNSAIEHRQEILNLLEAVRFPKQVAVMHCRGH